MRRVVLLGALVAPSALSAMPVPASAAVPVAGTCVFAPGAASFQANPGLTVNLLTTLLTITGSGTCVGNGLVNTVSVSFGGTLAMSCEGGEGTLVGTAVWSNGVPPTQVSIHATTVTASGVYALTFAGLGLVGNATFTATDTAPATCLTTSASGGSLAGSMSYIWTGA